MVVDSLDKVEIKELIMQFIGDSPVYICGVSALGRVMSQWMDYHEIDYVGFVDRKGKADWTDKVVLTYCDVFNMNSSNCRYIVTQKLYRQEVEEDLLKSGVSKECILQFKDEATFDCLYYDLLPESDCFKELSKFKGSCDGKRCFVVGNGPSLLEKDIHRIKKEYSFAANMMYENFERLRWKPSYYIVYDRTMSRVFEENESSLMQTLNSVGIFFAEYKTGLYTKYYDNKPDNLVFYKDITYRRNKNETCLFSEDMEKGLYRGQTVVYDALQMAVYMGFKRIYLLGVDMSYKKERKKDGTTVDNLEIIRNHADFVREPDAFESDTYEMVDEMELGFMAAKEYADNHNVEIYNATRGGKLEVFPRVDLESLF